MTSPREGWNSHGYWIGDPANEPGEGQPPRARCGGPLMCGTCTRVATQFPGLPGDDGLTEQQRKHSSPCKFCKARIIWAETLPNPAGRTPEKRRETKLIPFDAKPYPMSTWVLHLNGTGRPTCGEMKRGQAAGFRASGGSTYQKHVKTCTRVQDWPKGEFIAKQRGSK